MKLAGAVSKSGVLVLIGGFIVWFYSDLASVPASGSLFEKLILTTPVVLVIRVTTVLLALWLVGLAISNFWRGIEIRKIGKEGVEFGKVDETFDKTQSDSAARDAKIKELETRNKTLQKQYDASQELMARILSGTAENKT